MLNPKVLPPQKTLLARLLLQSQARLPQQPSQHLSLQQEWQQQEQRAALQPPLPVQVLLL
jgi:hypothetical protein